MASTGTSILKIYFIYVRVCWCECIPHACRCNGQNPSNGKISKWHFRILSNTKLTDQDPDKGPTSTTSQKDMHFLACWGTLAILSFWKWNQESSCLTFSEVDICLSSEGLPSADSRDLGEWGSCVSRVFHNYTQKQLESSCCSIYSTGRTRLSLFFHISGPSSDTGCFLSFFVFLKTESHVAQKSLKFVTRQMALPLPPKCWEYRCVSAHTASRISVVLWGSNTICFKD